MHSFPHNCCEIASLVLGYILKEEYPDIDFFVVKAEKSGYGPHFWLETQGKIFDITADQLEGMSAPIFGEPLTPLLQDFLVYEKSEICAELKDHDWSDRLHILPEISQMVRGHA